ncbi:MAG: MBL fold metallo-hydrolase [Deltaproteobacteria bacterium]|nr:MBL fold metallo-hydrolase [Deltaproteobacteria bacterium]
MTTPIAYPAPTGSLRDIRLYMQNGCLSPRGAEILLRQDTLWQIVARHVQDPGWWREQSPAVSHPPELPWRIQSWDAALRLQVPGVDIWIDPGPEAPIPAQAPNLIIVTHAHYDHTARLGDFSTAFPSARVVMSDNTYGLLSLQAQSDVQLRRCLEERTVRIELGAQRVIEGARLTLVPAGHLLGAAMIDVEVGDDAILVTGDFALRDVGGVPGAPWPEKRYSLVLIEATSVHRGALPVADPQANRMPFLQEVSSWLERGKTRILVTTQAMGQAQELYAALVLSQQAGAFPDLKVRLTRFAEVVSKRYYDALKESSRVWHCPFYTLEADRIPPQSVVISSEDEDSGLAQSLREVPDGECVTDPAVYTHAGWGERMTWAVGVPSHAVGLYAGYSSSLHTALSDIGRKVRALSQEGEEWLINEDQ